MKPFAFDYAQMRARREEYFRFVRDKMSFVFKSDGTYQPSTENDGRIAYWMYPALATSPDPKEREYANRIYAAASCWKDWNVFTTSSIAVILVRERQRLTPELIRRSEEHLAKFVVSEDGRTPSSGANDFVFHGYNDNMPAMCVRAMILSGEVLDRRDYLDRGLFYLEGLCAHFERRGLLSEHTSGTYLPITLQALMDVAECATTREAREMALACANRVLMDMLGHWHIGTGAIGGTQARAYTMDLTATTSVMNAAMWYLTGDPLCINPMEILRDVETFPAFIHCRRSMAFNLSQFVEVMVADYEIISPYVRDWGRLPREYPYEIQATTDFGQGGLFGGAKEIQCRAFHQPLYALATSSDTWMDQAGQQAVLQAVLATTPKPQSWQDRVTIWHKTIADAFDQGDADPTYDGPRSETSHVNDCGHYRTIQKRGSALVLGSLGPAMLDKEVSRLKFDILFGTFLRMPDEIIKEGKWHFLRFGDVYVGLRISAMVGEQRMMPYQVLKNKYLRFEISLIEGRAVTITQEFREECNFGYVLEIAAKDECGSFTGFRQECLACSWEFYHSAYRTSRYCGRHGELQIMDSVAAGTVRFMAIDGVVEPKMKFSATGLDPKAAQLFPDGHRVKQRRLVYQSDFIGSPFHKQPEHILETDEVSSCKNSGNHWQA